MQNYTGDKDNLGKCEQVGGVLPFVVPFPLTLFSHLKQLVLGLLL